MGACHNKGSATYITKGRNVSKNSVDTPPISYMTPNEKDQLKRDITDQFFKNYRTFGIDGEKANKMIIDGFLKEGIIDAETADALKKTDKKVKMLEVDTLNMAKEQKLAFEKQTKALVEKQEKRKADLAKWRETHKKDIEKNSKEYQKKKQKQEKKQQEIKKRQEEIKRRNKELDNEGGLGLNTDLPAITATYKRWEKRQRKKIDEWLKGK